MRIKSEIHDKYTEIEVHVCNNKLNDKVKDVMQELHALYDDSLIGTDERGNRCVIAPAEIISFYSEGQKVIAQGNGQRYQIPRRLYELEESLSSAFFVRISKSEIINYKKITKLDLSIMGTIKVIMNNGYETYISRRNMTKIKELLRKESGK